MTKLNTEPNPLSPITDSNQSVFIIHLFQNTLELNC